MRKTFHSMKVLWKLTFWQGLKWDYWWPCQQIGSCDCKTAAISLQIEPDRVGVKPGKGLHCGTQQNIQISWHVWPSHFCVVANYVWEMASRYWPRHYVGRKDVGAWWARPEHGRSACYRHRRCRNKQGRRASVFWHVLRHGTHPFPYPTATTLLVT
jgi:hypothetical protein